MDTPVQDTTPALKAQPTPPKPKTTVRSCAANFSAAATTVTTAVSTRPRVTPTPVVAPAMVEDVRLRDPSFTGRTHVAVVSNRPTDVQPSTSTSSTVVVSSSPPALVAVSTPVSTRAQSPLAPSMERLSLQEEASATGTTTPSFSSEEDLVSDIAPDVVRRLKDYHPTGNPEQDLRLLHDHGEAYIDRSLPGMAPYPVDLFQPQDNYPVVRPTRHCRQQLKDWQDELTEARNLCHLLEPPGRY